MPGRPWFKGLSRPGYHCVGVGECSIGTGDAFAAATVGLMRGENHQ